MSNLKEKFNRVREICGGWGLYEPGNSTEQAQLLKALSEVGELADSILKNDREQAKDDIGDILVCLINAYRLSGAKNNLEDQADFNVISWNRIGSLANLLEDIASGLRVKMTYISPCDWVAELAADFGLTLEECLDQAISVIEKRKGRIVNGAFVKDSE